MNDDTDTTKTEDGMPLEPVAADTAPASDETDPAPTPAATAPESTNTKPETAAVVDLDAARTEARGEAAAEAGLIAELCTLAGMPQRAADMIGRGLSADEARKELLSLKANADAEVHNHVLPGAGTGAIHTLDDNPVVRAATARAAQAKEA